MPTWRIERLSDAHDRSAFDCGKPALDDFLKRLAGQYERRDFAAVYVATTPPSNAVLGYYSLSSGSVDLTALPEAVRKSCRATPFPLFTSAGWPSIRTSGGKGWEGISLRTP